MPHEYRTALVAGHTEAAVPGRADLDLDPRADGVTDALGAFLTASPVRPALRAGAVPTAALGGVAAAGIGV
ncbi:hypothetical protein GCM10009838_06030 [Catenulispora subtropica]|uniref:Uncharacterized protein n=1 Tax=Catenulispora subtropica TaxID=450798 RepID=A0ABN2QJR7_9ACTN